MQFAQNFFNTIFDSSLNFVRFVLAYLRKTYQRLSSEPFFSWHAIFTKNAIKRHVITLIQILLQNSKNLAFFPKYVLCLCLCFKKAYLQRESEISFK